ncbi:type II secretion system F family protein [Nocardioides acrostichi]|uniref:Type II secretion system F family protein n=1 Tax=Nocardioides acrostichi TaxID=2784339 RepID=A0A930UTI7_9ACTN|nr:type II secretion system F family protein [Nocardioides acrostichi]MBF4160563.1 type II secretion system F family protein [Nocardioides acrostichi]
MLKILRLLGALFAALVGLVVVGGPALAADGSIQYVQPGENGTVSILVSVPADATADLKSVGVTIGGSPVDATAVPAKTSQAVKRSAVLVIDTSDSMSGATFDAAKQAAQAFVDGLPSDVSIGIVTFAKDVAEPLALTDDHAAATSVIDGLSLARGTALYDGIQAAAQMAGAEGQRTLLVLSDGADTTKSSLSDVTGAIEDSGVIVDVVSLDGAPTAALKDLAGAGSGQVIPATSQALESTFAAEADALDRQVLVTAQVPASLTSNEQTVAVSLDTDQGPVKTSVLATVADVANAPSLAPPVTSGGFAVPAWAMFVGVALLGAGLVSVAILLVPAKAAAPSVEERITTYTSTTFGAAEPEKPKLDATEALGQAKDVAAQMLRRNRGLEQRISHRLEGAGSELKPNEWLLVHLGIVIVAGLLGLLIGGGSIVLGLVFLALGVVGPWVFLGLKRSRRRRKFNDSLPDVLGLMSGALTAGLSLSQAADTVHREGPEPVATEFKRVLVETRLGVDLETALGDLAVRFDSKDFAWVVMAIKIQRQVGGNLAELLDTVAETMRERAYLRRQVAALAAEGKLSAYVLGGLPPIFLLYLVLTNGSYVNPLFTDPRGLIMLFGGGLWLGVGAFWMSKLVKVEV